LFIHYELRGGKTLSRLRPTKDMEGFHPLNLRFSFSIFCSICNAP
jgi:5,10-methylene-tetrahydrofolate dehydrogenase/methenyl tetrahydrofolate cyclohydrolase